MHLSGDQHLVPSLDRTVGRKILGTSDKAGMACSEHLTLPSFCTVGENEAQKSPRCHNEIVTKPRPEPGSHGQPVMCPCRLPAPSAPPLPPLSSAVFGPGHTLILLFRVPSLTFLDWANYYLDFRPMLSFPTTQTSLARGQGGSCRGSWARMPAPGLQAQQL